MALTGGLSANGKPALMAIQIWKDDVNKKGGLLGRPVELIAYDDQTNPATVPGIYTKLLEVDKVDFVVSGYGTNLIAPLMPIAMERKLTIMGILGLASNEKYKYSNYFQLQPSGPEPGGMVRASAETGLQPKIFGGGMVGLQFTTVMTSLGPMLNGIVNYDFWAPESTMMFPGIKEFFAEYQKRAKEAGVDPLGYYLP